MVNMLELVMIRVSSLQSEGVLLTVTASRTVPSFLTSFYHLGTSVSYELARLDRRIYWMF
jgi:hypothetical protein